MLSLEHSSSHKGSACLATASNTGYGSFCLPSSWSLLFCMMYACGLFCLPDDLWVLPGISITMYACLTYFYSSTSRA